MVSVVERSETERWRETESCERTPRREERSFDILTAKVVGINKPLEIGQRNSTVGKKTRRTLFGYLAVVTWWTVEGMGASAGANGWGRSRVGVEGSGCDRGPRAAGRGPWATGHRHQPSSHIDTWGTKGANENRSAVQGGRKDGTTILVRPDRQRTRSWRWRRWRQRRRGWEWEREQAWVRARLLGRVRGQEC